ncbi:MAG: 30S ribosomal protein S2, partial [Paludibacteraceae bacterium]|nr:30S ribosomal protein S2 [Paludibacteraceae bacterium]
IPANDDATKSIEVILNALCGAIKEGLDERKVEKEENEASEAPEQKKERKRTTAKKSKANVDGEALNAKVASKFEVSED